MQQAGQSKEIWHLLCGICILEREPVVFFDKAYHQEKVASSILIFCAGILMEYESS